LRTGKIAFLRIKKKFHYVSFENENQEQKNTPVIPELGRLGQKYLTFKVSL
jgi:hypothetical protein